jgi:hypothetical protein
MTNKIKKWFNAIGTCCQALIVLAVILFLVFAFNKLATASGYHHNTIIKKTEYIEQCGGVGVSNSMAALSFDQNVSGLQWGVGAGGYDGDNCRSQGLSFGLGQRLKLGDKSYGIMNGSLGIEEGGGKAWNLGITGTF